MAILSNINGKFAVDSSGGIQFNGQTGTSGYVLKSNGNAAPTWVDGSTVIGGPYLPLSGGTLTGATATASGISFTVGGTLTGTSATFTGNVSIDANSGVLTQEILKVKGGGSGGAFGFLVEANNGDDLFKVDTSTYNCFFPSSFTKVGIGTVLPSSRLTVASPAAYSGSTFRLETLTSPSSYYLEFVPADEGASGITWTINQKTGASLYSNTLKFVQGRVGIGTSSPNALLSLGNAINAQKLLLYDDNNNFKYGFGIQSNELRQFFPNSATARMVIGTISDSDGTTFSEKIRISSNGNVGIGTASPSSDISGSATVLQINDAANNNLASLALKAGTQGSKWEMAALSANALGFFDDGTERMRIDSSGNVGIGATNVEGRLNVRMNFVNQNWIPDGTSAKWGEVWDNVGTPGTYFNDVMLHVDTNRSGGATGGVVGIAFSPGWQGHQNWGIYSFNTAGSGSTSGDLAFTSQLNNGTIIERVRFNGATGNVGIGNTSPGAKLVVGANVNSNASGIEVNAGAGGGNVLSNGTADNWFPYVDNNNYYSAQQHIFRSETNSSIRMTIKSSGNVGIGTSAPGAKLEAVYGGGYNTGIKVRSTSGYAVLTMEAPTNNYPILEFKEAGTQKWQVFNEPADDSLNFYAFGSSAGTRMSISQNGVIQNNILTTTQSSAVRFSNSPGGQNFTWGMIIEDDSLQTGYILFSAQNGSSVGSITRNGLSTQFNTTSDYRLKEDLQDFAGLEMVSKIPVYDFKWKTYKNRSYGVMAHELQEVLPDAVVGKKDAEEMQGVDYSKIVPLLIKSIQELKAEIDELKK